MSGVRQGSIIASWLFCGPIDWIMSRTCHEGRITAGPSGVTDFVYADDAAILTEKENDLLHVLGHFQKETSTVDLRPS